MKKFGMMCKKLFVVLLGLILGQASFSMPPAHAALDPLTMYDSTITFDHFDYTLNSDNSFQSGDPNNIVSTVFNTKVIENSYLKVTFLPEYGGRLLSIIYKPTGHELLYQNPVGAPYGIGEGNFYYDWLMVYGGIMPTFSEPEHGKGWLLPWNYQVVVQNSEQISIEMSLTDNINFTGTPGKFNNGETGITCIATYTVYVDKPYVEMDVKVINNKNQSVNYEYWTCNTLAPGSQPGNTVGSETMEIVAPMTEVKNKDDWWPWMATVDNPVDAANHIFEFDNLAHFSNWDDMGIAYAHNLSGDWWGVINHDNEEGILRIADNDITSGMKIWTWGFDQSYDTDPETEYGNSARPYIELWGGNSSEFFEDATLQPLEQKEWTEYYMPTVGLEQITNATKDAAAYLHFTEGTDAVTFNADIFSTLPDQTMNSTLRLVGDTTYVLDQSTFIGDSDDPTNIAISENLSNIEEGDYTYELVVKDSNNATILEAEIPYHKGSSGGDLSSTTWNLFNNSVSGVTPSGENMQDSNSGVTGWQPIKTIGTTPSYWYTPELNGTYSSGQYDFTLWTNNPGASNVTVELYVADADGSNQTLLGSQTHDISTSGGGNHPTLYSYNLSEVSLSNQRVMVKIFKQDGADATMAYNTNDFPTRLVTP